MNSHSSHPYRGSAVLVCGIVAQLVGCEKVPTFQELTGQQQNSSSNTPSNATTPAAERPPQASPKIDLPAAAPLDPAKVLSEFQAKPSNQIYDEDLKNVASLEAGREQITALDLTRGAITDAGLQHLAKLPELTELNLTSTSIDGNGFAALRDCPNLKKLKLSGVVKMTPQGWESLSTVTQLEIVDVSGNTNVTDSDVAKFTALVNLRELDLSRTPITDKAFDSLAAMENLSVLRIENNGLIDGSGLQAYSRSKPVLRELHARATQLGRAGLRNVKLIAALEFLDISGTLLNDPQFAEIKGANSLVHLKVGENALTNAGLQPVLTLGKLKVLDLEGMQTITDPVLNILTKKSGLETLNLRKTPCTARAIQAFRKLHKNCEVLASE